jgi:hypothetical protein
MQPSSFGIDELHDLFFYLEILIILSAYSSLTKIQYIYILAANILSIK